MAKFVVGEKCLAVCVNYSHGFIIGESYPVIVESILGSLKEEYRVNYAGHIYVAAEKNLRKLPGDERKDFIPPEVRKLFIPSKEKANV